MEFYCSDIWWKEKLPCDKQLPQNAAAMENGRKEDKFMLDAKNVTPML